MYIFFVYVFLYWYLVITPETKYIHLFYYIQIVHCIQDKIKLTPIPAYIGLDISGRFIVINKYSAKINT